MTATEVLAAHQWGTGACICGPMVCSHADMAAHQLDALKAAGFAVERSAVQRDIESVFLTVRGLLANDSDEADKLHLIQGVYDAFDDTHPEMFSETTL